MNLIYVGLLVLGTLCASIESDATETTMERTACAPGETFAQYAERLSWSVPSEWTFLDQQHYDVEGVRRPRGINSVLSVREHHLNFMFRCLQRSSGDPRDFGLTGVRVRGKNYELSCLESEPMRRLFLVSNQEVSAAEQEGRRALVRRIVGEDGAVSWRDLVSAPEGCWLARAIVLWKRQCYQVDYRPALAAGQTSCPNDTDESSGQLCQNLSPGWLTRMLDDRGRSTAFCDRYLQETSAASPPAARTDRTAAHPPPAPPARTSGADSIRARDAR